MLYLGRENSAPISAPAQTGDTLPASAHDETIRKERQIQISDLIYQSFKVFLW